MGFARINHTDQGRRDRDKRNIEYRSPDGTPFFAKYVRDTEKNPFNIWNLENEHTLLTILQATGVVPRVGDMKYYPDMKRPTQARLLIEAVPGTSLEQRSYAEAKAAGIDPNDVIIATARSLQAIHDKRVLLVDVNPGAFIIDRNDDGLQAKVVDFELGIYLDQYTPKRLQSASHFLEMNDPGLHFGDRQHYGHKLTAEQSRMVEEAEMYSWAMTMSEWLLGPIDQWPNISLPPAAQTAIDQDLRYYRPRIELAAEIFYANTIDQVKRSQLVQDVIEHESKKLSAEHTIASQLQHADISLRPRVLLFLKYALKNMPDARYTDFFPILNT